MKKLRVEIKSLKNFQYVAMELPMEKGLYAITGANGTGKSTIMRAIAKLVQRSAYNKFQHQDYNSDTLIKLEYDGVVNQWKRENGTWKCDSEKPISIQGFYEGSIIHGTRFCDANYGAILKAEGVKKSDLIDADDYLKENLSYILYGDKDSYSQLKRIKNLDLARMKNFKGLPYFIEGENGLVNQFCMSSGENLLICLLHMLNSFVIRKKNISTPRLILIDEIELSLHPSAIMRLVDLLSKLSSTYNLVIYFSSHSVELIRQIRPENLFYLQKESNGISIVNPCFPAYATRDIYQHSGFDKVILVEDDLAKKIVEKVIDASGLYKSRLINVQRVGTWDSVLRMHDDMVKSKLIGSGTSVLSILDGDAEDDFKRRYYSKGIYTNIAVSFLPIKSLEKYLHAKLVQNKDVSFFKEIGDRFFKAKSLKDVINEMQSTNDNKIFYKNLVKALEEQGVERGDFERKVCEHICAIEDFSALEKFLHKELGGKA